jgi:hypothetical protein
MQSGRIYLAIQIYYSLQIYLAMQTNLLVNQKLRVYPRDSELNALVLRGPGGSIREE